MKKYITLAALLAAGTAYANAEDVVLELPASTEKANNPGTNVGPTLTGDIKNIFSYYADKDLGTLWVTSNANGLGNYPQNGEGTWVYENNAGTITLCGRKGASGDHAAFILGEGVDAGTSLKSLEFSAGAISDESYVSSYQLVIGVLNADGTLIGSSDVASYDTTTDSATAVLTFDSAITWEAGYKIIAGLVASGNSGSSNTSAYTVSGITASYVVPEPSAFGLLAGVGALALAASRRRRR